MAQLIGGGRKPKRFVQPAKYELVIMMSPRNVICAACGTISRARISMQQYASCWKTTTAVPFIGVAQSVMLWLAELSNRLLIFARQDDVD